MWKLIRNTGAAISGGMSSEDALVSAVQLSNMLNGRAPEKDCLAVLSSIAALSEKYSGNVTFAKPVPNIETAFVLRIVSLLEEKLSSDDNEAAGAVAAALGALPELSALNDEKTVSDFNELFLGPVNQLCKTQLKLLLNW